MRRRSRDHGILADAGLLLVAGLIAGMVVAAALFPAVALAGLGAKTSSERFDELPSSLAIPPLPETTDVFAADGHTLITSFYEENRHDVPITAVAPLMQKAVVAAEDARFYQHHGVDFKGMVRAFVANNQSGRVSEGASTLTMQYVRNVLVYSAKNAEEVQAATEKTADRKLREIRFAIGLEKQLTKDEILERYLNIAYFGHQTYGVWAASQVYFGKAPASLTMTEAATLAGLVKAPSDFDPAGVDTSAALDRRNWVIDRMVEQEYVTGEEAITAKQQPITLRLRPRPNECVSVTPKHNDWGFFCDYFKEWWRAQPMFGDTTTEREQKLRRGGFRIVTTLDPGIQAAAQRHILERESKSSQYAFGMVVVEPGSGRIKAMAVNRNYSLDQRHNGANTEPAKRARGIKGNYPNTVNPLLSGGTGLPGYQAGSTFKMFTLLAALDRGISMDTSIYAPARYKSKVFFGEATGNSSCGGMWCPQNASNAMTGSQNLWSGFGKSVNTFFAQLIERVGAANAVRMAERVGLHWRDSVDRHQATVPGATRQWGAFTLGVANTVPLEMANAYATVAAQGKYCAPLPVLSITDVAGKPVKVGPTCHQAVRQSVARAATDVARCPVNNKPFYGSCGGWSTAPQVGGIVGRPVAGKTGTTDNTRAAWFVGFTPQLAAASFFADPDNPFHAVGDWQSNKPIEAVALTLRDGSRGKRVVNFAPEPRSIAYGRDGQFSGAAAAPRSDHSSRAGSDRDHPADSPQPPARRRGRGH